MSYFHKPTPPLSLLIQHVPREPPPPTTTFYNTTSFCSHPAHYQLTSRGVRGKTRHPLQGPSKALTQRRPLHAVEERVVHHAREGLGKGCQPRMMLAHLQQLLTDA